MLKAPIPPDEAKRLAALQALHILDTEPEERFDRVARLAQKLFDIPVSLVTLIDAQRQWFKARQGPVPMTEMPREISFCGHTILGDSVFVVPDTVRDPRFSDNPLVTGPFQVRFYAGCPLEAVDGSKIGTLCILDGKPRELKPEDIKALVDLAEIAELEINNVALNQALTRVSESEATLYDFLDNANDLVQMVTPGDRFLYVNRAWRHHLGYTEKEVEGLSALEVVEPSSHKVWVDAYEKALAGQTIYNLQVAFRAKGGRVSVVEGHLSCRFKDRKPLYTRAIFRDITERKRVEQMKNDLLSIVNHELRNPLSAIHGAMELMLGRKQELPPELLRYADMGFRNCKMMLRLIGDYLDIDKIESGRMELDLKPADPAAAASQAVETVRGLAENRKVRVALEAAKDVQARADPDRLAQVVLNLLTNAVKFSPENGVVTVRVAPSAGGARITVSDQGPGIPPEFVPRLFERFSQDASGRRAGGSGLGLCISKALVEGMGGTITFETGSKGTSFHLDLLGT